jgi:hypothetical protein
MPYWFVLFVASLISTGSLPGGGTTIRGTQEGFAMTEYDLPIDGIETSSPCPAPESLAPVFQTLLPHRIFAV